MPPMALPAAGLLLRLALLAALVQPSRGAMIAWYVGHQGQHTTPSSFTS